MVRQLDGYGRVTLPRGPFETEADRGTAVIALDFNTVIFTLQRSESQKVLPRITAHLLKRSFRRSD